MNYELAKELKDAGFPFRPDHSIYIEPDGTSKQSYVLPTLSELIEACGWDGDRRNPKMLQLYFNSRDYEGTLVQEWVAMGPCVSYSDGENYETKGNMLESGSTPEEAVARLWLALNKKV